MDWILKCKATNCKALRGKHRQYINAHIWNLEKWYWWAYLQGKKGDAVIENRICFWTMVLEKTLEGPLDCEEIKPVNPNGNHLWILTGRTEAEAEAPTVWPPDARCQLTGKDPDAGRDWGQEEKGMTEDEMVGWHHWLSGHEFGQTPGESEGQGTLQSMSQICSLI